jgi:DNA topoisomerase VI subunit B
MSKSDISIKSHVPRDLLQSASLFKTASQVVWEYVSNGLDYVDQGVAPSVYVTIDNAAKAITVEDNGRGMDWEGLKNYFIMHGENIDRKAGRATRGLFGTGKSAAFGIADMLRITSRRNGKRSCVSISRHEIKATQSSTDIPLRVEEREVPVNESNGTLVEIEGIRLRTIDQPEIIRYLEKHIARWQGNVTVYVNNHMCQYSEPPIAAEYRYVPEGEVLACLGRVPLTIKPETGVRAL